MSKLRWVCVVPTWNSIDVIERCLQSIADQTRAFDEVIIVDNCSKDETCLIVRKFDFANLIKFPNNRGFAAAINYGIRISTADVIVWLNADAYLDRAFLENLDLSVYSNQNYCIFAPKILLPLGGTNNFPNCIENVGNFLWLDGLNWCIGRGEQDLGQYDRNHTPMFPSGAVCAIRRNVFDSIGPLDESFFAYGEDADFGLRAFLAGYSCLFIAEARAMHSLSHSIGMNSAKKVYLIERNRILVAWKNFPMGLLTFSILFSAIRYSGWLFALKDNSRVRPIIEHLGRIKLLAIIFIAHFGAIKMILKGKIFRKVQIQNSLKFIEIIHPFLVSLRDLIST
jgi:GT2 family glycosyltransferase